mgnify:CR=1 FL=1
MNSITACMIIKDEGDKIYNTLSSIYYMFDEFVIIDTGSSDNTTDEVNRFINDKLSQCNSIKPIICDYFEWVNDFSAARNFSYQKATKDFVTWWDADDRVTEQLATFFKEFRFNPEYETVDVVHIPTVIQVNEEGVATQYVDNTRVIRRSLNPHWIYRIHEQLLYDSPKGVVIYSILNRGEYVDAVEDYSKRSHHLNFYANLANSDDYEFTMHDLYFFLNEMLVTGDISYWEKYKEVFRRTINKPTKFPGYPGMIYKRVKENFKQFYNEQFMEIAEEIFNQQLKYFGTEPRLCIWIGEYYEYIKKLPSVALVWYQIGTKSTMLPDYEHYDIELAQQQSNTHYQKLLKEITDEHK